MRFRFLVSLPALAAVAAIFALTPAPAKGQAAKSAAAASAKSAPAAARTWSHPKTPWGDPDIQGTWTSDDCIGTPLNRPANFGDRLYYTEQELNQRQQAIERQQKNDLVETVAENQRVGTGPPGHWGERARRPCRQTSLVIDPQNGRTPELLPEAKLRPVPEGAGNNAPKADSWEDFTYYIRCITRGVPGSIFPVIYGNGQQIVQAKGFVTIMQEMVHEARVIPVDGSPHASPKVRSYMGDPRGHWEGNTLVVETTNFLGNRTGIVGNGGGTPTSDAMKTVERFTRVGPNEMKYEITIDDPKTYAKPFKVGFPLTQEPGYQNFEYACHEGNYAMFDSLSGARAKEKAAAEAAKRK
jgi:hypothetical protein